MYAHVLSCSTRPLRINKSLLLPTRNIYVGKKCLTAERAAPGVILSVVTSRRVKELRVTLPEAPMERRREGWRVAASCAP